LAIVVNKVLNVAECGDVEVSENVVVDGGDIGENKRTGAI
jgi:hypothetical protein